MEAMPRLQQAASCQNSRSGHTILHQLQTIVIGFIILGLSSSTTIAIPGTGNAHDPGSLRAQLLHREHPLSPLRSLANLSQADRFYSEAERSAWRVRNHLGRRQLGDGRSSQVQESTFQSTIIEGTDGEYLMTFSVGTPARNFIAIADTGSDLVWVQCAPCVDCFNQSVPVFSPNKSSTYKKQSCASAGCEAFISQYGQSDTTVCESSSNSTTVFCPPYEYPYGAGVTVGTFSEDSITLTSTDGHDVIVPDFWFGCSNYTFSSSSIFNSSQGLVGLGRALISFPSQLANRNLTEDKFAYCLVNRSLAMVQSSLILFGHDDVLSATVAKEIQYTPLLSNPNPSYFTFYYVSLEAIFVDGVALNFSASQAAINVTDGSRGTIFDSGTPFTTLTLPIWLLLGTAVDDKLSGMGLPSVNVTSNVTQPAEFEPLLCYDFTGIPKADYTSVVPSISFKFANASTYDLGFEHSWVLLEEDTVVCLAYNVITDDSSMNVYGNVQMQDYYLEFDRGNQRIGFAPTDCGSLPP